jgi:hypothetical protein
MTCIALHCHRQVCRSRSGPGRSALRFCKVRREVSALVKHPPSFTRLSSGTAKRTSVCARRDSGFLLSRTPSPKQVWVPFP